MFRAFWGDSLSLPYWRVLGRELVCPEWIHHNLIPTGSTSPPRQQIFPHRVIPLPNGLLMAYKWGWPDHHLRYLGAHPPRRQPRSPPILSELWKKLLLLFVILATYLRENFRVAFATTVLAFAEHMGKQELSRPFRGESGVVYLRPKGAFLCSL